MSRSVAAVAWCLGSMGQRSTLIEGMMGMRSRMMGTTALGMVIEPGMGMELGMGIVERTMALGKGIGLGMERVVGNSKHLRNPASWNTKACRLVLVALVAAS